jgi:hypothetical protein
MNPLSKSTLKRLQNAAIADKDPDSRSGKYDPISQELNNAILKAWREVFPDKVLTSRNHFADEFDKLCPNWRGYYVSYQPEYKQNKSA